MKAKRSKWFHCKTSRFLFLQNKILKKLRKNYSKFDWLPGKIINVVQSFSFQLYEIIIDYLYKVSWSNVKTMFGRDINKSIFSDKSFSELFIWLKERSVEFFFFLNYLFNKVWWLLSPRKSCALKNSWLHACSWFLSNIFKSLVISFVYLTNHFTNSRIKLYTFCILSVQSQHKNNIKTTLHKTLF